MLEIFQRQKLFSFTLRNTSPETRIQKLKTLRNAVTSRTDKIKAALHKDFRKPPEEVDLSEVFPTLSELDFAIKNVRTWMRPTKARTPLTLIGTRSEVRFEPKGVVLIIGPWNYPFQLMMAPLISAISAGNCAILKPSELAPNTSHLIKELISEIFDPQEIACFEGDAEVSQNLLKLPFDHIFFTGSTRLGKIVMEAAARHLASVTLELGGKSPAIVDNSASLVQSAKRIVWGKFFNAGQTCIAPDYVLVPQDKMKDFLQEARKAVSSAFGESDPSREKTKDLCRIVNLPHFRRIKAMVDESVKSGSKIEIGGLYNEADRYIAPTLLSSVQFDSPIMMEEIFGPVLPILSYSDLKEVYSELQKREKPLALYIFSQDKHRTQEIINNTSSGGTCINHTLIHLTNPHLPFGGVGSSGIGSYHGYFGFKAFSHERAVMKQGPFATLDLFFPPYGEKVRRLIQLTLRFLT